MSEMLVDDLDTTVRFAVATLSTAVDHDWHVSARDLRWTCWETLEHVAAVAEPLRVPWQPADDVVRRVLDRLFPDAPRDGDPWPTPLWVTGRTPLGDRPRLDHWRWDSSVR